MKYTIAPLLGVVCLLGACASTPAAPTFGDEIRLSGVSNQALADEWDEATKDERKALKLVDDGRDRLTKGEKMIVQAKKDTRKGEDLIERGESEIRQGERDAASAKQRREQAEDRYRSATGTSLLSAATGGGE